MRSNVNLVVAILFLFSGNAWCATVESVSEHAHGVYFDLDQGALKLQVIDDHIIRVLVSPVDTFPARKSLIIDEKKRTPVAWTLQKSNHSVTLTTARLEVRVQRATAEIGFFDLDGKPILLERKGGGKLITPAEVCGEQTYHVRQQWQLMVLQMDVHNTDIP